MSKILQWVTIFSILLWIIGSGFIHRQEATDPTVEIVSPLDGEAVQGLVSIIGRIEAENLHSFIVEFAFASQDNPGWFSISSGDEIPADGFLGEWDTSTIPDDTYDIRLTVNFEDKDPMITFIKGVRVRNYSVIETNTPEPTSEISPTPTSPPEASPTPTIGMTPIPTSLSKNPAELSSSDLQSALINGSIAGLATFVVLLIFWLLRENK